MPSERYFLDRAFVKNDVQELRDAEFHHLAHAMRTKKGDKVELVNGKGSWARAIVRDILKEKALVVIESTLQEPLTPPRLILAQALPKPSRLDFILEKGTELGVDLFWLFPGCYSVKKELSTHQLERAHAIALAAMKQCGRLTLPGIILKPPLAQWSALTNVTLFFGDLSPDASSFSDVWSSLPLKSSPIVFFIGPEGGFHPQETSLLRHQGGMGLKLHPNILRTDTAALAALTLFSQRLPYKPEPSLDLESPAALP